MNRVAAEETAAQIRAAGGRAEACACDVTRAEDVDAAVALARRVLGRLDIVVNCAGILRVAPLEDTSEKEWEEVLAVNLTGAFLLTRSALRALREQGGGAIVHIASRAAIRAKEGHGAYSASKAGILQLTQMAAVEGARHGIRVNCVCPGFIDTPMTRGMYDMGRRSPRGRKSVRSAGPARPRTWPRRCSSSPRRTPASSRASRSRSTAAGRSCKEGQ